MVSLTKILASDYNNLVDRINEVTAVGTGDSGYGDPVLPTVTVTPRTIIQNEDWLAVRSNIELAGTHQGVVPPLPPVGDLEDGDIIQCFPLLDSGITTVTDNRLNVNAANTTVNASVLSSVRTTSWSTQIKHVFTANFGSDDDARHFFNTGGQIRVTMDGPNDVAGHNWGDIYDTAGTYIFDYTSYYSLSSTINNPTELRVSDTGGGAYSFGGNTNLWIISARFTAGTSTNGARGSTVEISSISTDVYSGHPSFPGSPDVVVGTFTSTIGERRSTVVYNRPSPVYTTVTALTAGS